MTRKELRTLTPEQREAFFEAVSIMRRTTHKEGKETYGESFRTLQYLTRKHASAVLEPECDQGHIYPAFWVFHSALLREYELSLLAINDYLVAQEPDAEKKKQMKVPGLPYWNWFIDVQAHGSIEESSLWYSYFGSYYGDPANKYQTVGHYFDPDEWKVPTLDSILESEKELLAQNGLKADGIREEISNGDYTFGTFNGYGYLRAPYSTADAPSFTRNPGRVGNAPMGWITPLEDIVKCTSPDIKEFLDWDLCLNRLADGLFRVPHAFAGTFNDEGISYAPLAPAGVAIAVFATLFLCCPLKRLICGKPGGRSPDGAVAWIGLALVAVTMIATPTLHTGELVAGVSPAVLIALWSNLLMAPRNLLDGLLECPAPGTCIVGETAPKDCACRYTRFSLQQFLTLNQPPASRADYFDPTSAPNDPVFWVFLSFYGMLFDTWARNAKETPSAANRYGGFPEGDPDLDPEDRTCYGHAYKDAVNRNFCFTAKDLGLDDKVEG